MRAAGLPARVVVGYQGGQWNPLGKHYTVRQSDAHAWTELWLEGRGWTRFDPTAVVAPDRVDFGAQNYAALQARGAGRDAEENAEFVARLQQPTGWRWAVRQAHHAWDTVEQHWDLWVVDYDASSQKEVFQRLGITSLGQRISQQLRLASAGGNNSSFERSEWTALLGGGALFLGLGLTLALGALAVRGVRWWQARREEEPAARLYRQFCARAARAAAKRDNAEARQLDSDPLPPRAAAEGPLDFAARASRALPARAAQIAEITRLYVQARYGRGDPAAAGGSPVVPRLRAAVRRFKG